MRLKPTPPNSLRDVRDSSRTVLEKVKDLTRPRTFESVITKHLIAQEEHECDVMICLQQLKEMLDCYLDPTLNINVDVQGEYVLLGNKIETLIEKVSVSYTNKRMLSVSAVAVVLKQHTATFNRLSSRGYTLGNCTNVYDQFVLSSVAIWNNQWE
ncbi:MAG: hypothetical protein AAF632_20660 [Bacteroidota bacterium]